LRSLDYDRLAAEYARHRQVHPAVLQGLAEAVRPGDRVLEVGCGTGNYIVALASLGDCTCWGVEPSAEMLSRARERSTAVQFQAGSADRLGVPAGWFDLLFSVDVVHHLPDLPVYFREAHRALKSGGCLYTVTDSEAIIRSRQPLVTYFPETVAADLSRYPSMANLRTLYGRAGFGKLVERTVECAYSLNDIGPYRDKAYSVLHLISEQALRRGIARMERDLRAGSIACISRYSVLRGVKRSS
jgi:ubiquinone/menaquinone biosynthesis C-methylase UbiE